MHDQYPAVEQRGGSVPGTTSRPLASYMLREEERKVRVATQHVFEARCSCETICFGLLSLLDFTLSTKHYKQFGSLDKGPPRPTPWLTVTQRPGGFAGLG